MDLMDFLGNAFGGPNNGNDLQSQMISQLGGDPVAMRKQAAMQSLGQMGAAMLANSGPTTQRHSFASILGQGLQAGQGGMADAQGQSLNRLYMLQNMKRTQTADEKAQADLAEAKALHDKLQSPEFIAKLPASMQPTAGMLAHLPAAQAVELITKTAAQDAQDTRQGNREDAAAKRQQAMFDQQTKVQLMIADRANAAQAAAAGRLPPELSLLPPGEQADAVRARYGLIPKASASTPQDKATVKRASEINDQLGKLAPLVDQLDSLSAGFQAGVYNTGGGGMFDKLGRRASEVLPPSMRGDQTNLLDKATNQLVLDVQQNMKNTRGSNMLLHIIERSKPGVGLSSAANAQVLKDMRGPLTKQVEALRAEQEHYANGGSLMSWNPSKPGGMPAPAAAAPGSAGSGEPAPPPGAVRGADGNWYNPATGKRYVWQGQ